MLDLNLMNCPAAVGLINSGVFWTPNDNGVNSYGEILEWNTQSEFEISFDLYVSSLPTASYAGLLSNTPAWMVLRSSGRIDCSSLGVPYVNGVANGIVEVRKVNKIVVKGSLANIKYIGAYGGIANPAASFKGQISELRLTDLESSDNSRYYKRVLNSKEMPTDDKIIDHLSTPEIYNYSSLQPTGSPPPIVTKNYIDDFDLIEGLSLAKGQRTSNTINATGYMTFGVTVKAKSESDVGKSISIGLKRSAGSDFVGRNKNATLELQEKKISVSILIPNHYPGTTGYINYKDGYPDSFLFKDCFLKKETHGQMFNFGNEDPWVELIK